MKSTVLSVAILTLIAVGPVQAQDSGIYLLGGSSGSVHNLGWVSKGTKIDVGVQTIRLGSDSTCPIRTTIIVMGQNASSKLQKVTKKQNAAYGVTTMSKAKFHGDALFMIQPQNASHFCISRFYIDLLSANAVPDSDTQDLSMQGMRDDDGSVDVWADDEVPDQSIPLQRDDIPEEFLDYLDNMPY